MSQSIPSKLAELAQALKVQERTESLVQKSGQFLAKITVDPNANPLRELKDGEAADPFEAFRQQLPKLTQKLLGKRYQMLNGLSQHVLPQGATAQVVDRVFEQLSLIAEHLQFPEEVLNAAKLHTFEQLQTQSLVQSDQLAEMLINRNRVLAAVQGGVTGAAGLIGMIVDVPLSFILAMRTIYQTAAAYGVDLSGREGRERILSLLSRLDLSVLGEKQVMMFSLGSVAQMLDQQDLNSLQQWLGSSNGTAFFDKLQSVFDERQVASLWSLSRFFPLVGTVAGSVYSSRLISLVAKAAQQEFRPQQDQAAQIEYQQESDSSLDASTQEKLDHFSEQVEADIALETETPQEKPPRKRTVRARKTGDGSIEPVSKTQH